MAQQLGQQRDDAGATVFWQLPKALLAHIEYLLLRRAATLLFHEVLLVIEGEDRGFAKNIAPFNHKSNAARKIAPRAVLRCEHIEKLTQVQQGLHRTMCFFTEDEALTICFVRHPRRNEKTTCVR